MTLPTSGNSISLNQLHVEAGGTSDTLCSLNDSDIRDIIGVSAAGSQNIQQYYGQSAESVSFDEVVTANNISGESSQTLSFSGGVSDHDVIIAYHYNSSGRSASYSSDPSSSAFPYFSSPGIGVNVDGARYSQVQTATSSMWFPHQEFWLLATQVIVLGPSSANSFTWHPNNSGSPQKSAQVVMIKYSTEAVQRVTIGSYVQGGRNALGEYGSSFGGVNAQVVYGTQTITPSVPSNTNVEGVLNVVAKGGDRVNTGNFDMTFGTTGDVSAVIGTETDRPTTNYAGNATGHGYGFQYYAKKEDTPETGSFSSVTVNTTPNGAAYYAGGFAYAHHSFTLRTDAP